MRPRNHPLLTYTLLSTAITKNRSPDPILFARQFSPALYLWPLRPFLIYPLPKSFHEKHLKEFFISRYQFTLGSSTKILFSFISHRTAFLTYRYRLVWVNKINVFYIIFFSQITDRCTILLSYFTKSITRFYNLNDMLFCSFIF